MIDKINLTAKIRNPAEMERFAARNRLDYCLSGNREWWATGELENLTGIQMKVAAGTVRVKCSLHKQHSRHARGTLDNSGPFSMAEARATLARLLAEWGIDADEAVVTRFEVGLTLPIGTSPPDTLALMEHIGTAGNRVRTFLEDANFDPLRQQTSRKSRLVRKVFKAYDKTHEARSRGRECPDGLLRVETVYRRQQLPARAFLDEAFTTRLADVFRRDWESAAFTRRVVGRSGVKASMVEKARCLLRLGADAYVAQARADLRDGLISPKQLRTVREFVRDWEQLAPLFTLVPDVKEIAFREMLLREWTAARG